MECLVPCDERGCTRRVTWRQLTECVEVFAMGAASTESRAWDEQFSRRPWYDTGFAFSCRVMRGHIACCLSRFPCVALCCALCAVRCVLCAVLFAECGIAFQHASFLQQNELFLHLSSFLEFFPGLIGTFGSCVLMSTVCILLPVCSCVQC